MPALRAVRAFYPGHRGRGYTSLSFSWRRADIDAGRHLQSDIWAAAIWEVRSRTNRIPADKQPRTGCLRIVPRSGAFQKYPAIMLRLPQWRRNHREIEIASPDDGKMRGLSFHDTVHRHSGD